MLSAVFAGRGRTPRPRTPAAPARRGGRALVPLSAALAVALLAAPARAQFSAEPVIVRLVPAAAPEEQVVRVRNEGAEELQFRFYTGDFDQTDEGENRFLEPGTHTRSCQGRISVFPDAATIRPGEAQDVRVRMEPGPSTCWSMVFLHTSAPDARGIRVGQRIAVKVYGVPPGVTAEGEIAQVTARPAADSVRVRFTFRNPGEDAIRPVGAVEIRTPAGEVVARAEVDAFSVLPGHVRHVEVVVPAKLARGQYLAVPVLDFGSDYLAGGQAVFEVP